MAIILSVSLYVEALSGSCKMLPSNPMFGLFLMGGCDMVLGVKWLKGLDVVK